MPLDAVQYADNTARRLKGKDRNLLRARRYEFRCRRSCVQEPVSEDLTRRRLRLGNSRIARHETRWLPFIEGDSRRPTWLARALTIWPRAQGRLRAFANAGAGARQRCKMLRAERPRAVGESLSRATRQSWFAVRAHAGPRAKSLS